MAAALNIAVIEDHDDLRTLTVELLRAQGHQASGHASAEALDLSQPADLFIIDLNLPGEDGLSLADRVRAARPQAGIVMVTARGKPADRVSGYGHGADLYLPKPVPPEELLAAIAALARRLPADAASLTLDTTQLWLTGPHGRVSLTPGEAALVEALALAPRRQLGLVRIAEVLGQELHELNKASLEVRVVRLRRKLAEAGAEAQGIKAVRGFGYQLCTPLTLKPVVREPRDKSR